MSEPDSSAAHPPSEKPLQGPESGADCLRMCVSAKRSEHLRQCVCVCVSATRMTKAFNKTLGTVGGTAAAGYSFRFSVFFARPVCWLASIKKMLTALLLCVSVGGTADCDCCFSCVCRGELETLTLPFSCNSCFCLSHDPGVHVQAQATAV